jgi:hypothetical protein
MKIKKTLDSLVSKDNKEYEHFYPRGAWTGKNSMDYADVSIPSKILNESLPKGGTLLEIMCGACDYVYEISKLNVWEIHATDIIASKFNTVTRSKENNINLYDIPIQVLLETNFKEKIDVYISNHAWGPRDKHWAHKVVTPEIENMNAVIEHWIWKNFNYILINDRNINDTYSNNQLVFNETYDNCNIQLVNEISFDRPEYRTVDRWCLFKLNQES